MAFDRREQNEVSQGRTGFTSIKQGDLIIGPKNGAEFLGRLPVGNPGQVLMVSPQKLPFWATLSGLLRQGLSAVLGALTVDSLTIGSLSGVLKASSGAVSGGATTTDVPEGDSLYFTEERALEAALGLVETGVVAGWRKLTVAYGSLATAGTSHSITLFALEPGEVLEAVRIHQATAFSGSGLGSLLVTLGIGWSLISPYDAISGDGQLSTMGHLESMTAPADVLLTANGDVALNGLNAGSLEIWVKTSKQL